MRSVDEAMRRAAAADPARDAVIDEAAASALIERVLATAIAPGDARDGSTRGAGEHPPGRSRDRFDAGSRVRGRGALVALVLVALLLAAAAALAAVGVIRLGTPASSPFRLSTPRSGLGALQPGSARLLAVSAPDPAGGPRWGMREVGTTRGVGCIEVGRVLRGRLGALGEDGAFGDDGRFHEFPVRGLFDGAVCADLDAHGRLFDTVGAYVVPASADGAAPSLQPGAPILRRATSDCPAADLRALSYGLLGPDARSVTYTLNGHRHTLTPSGPQGAYLIVGTPPCGRRIESTGGSVTPLPWDSPIDTIVYSDGTTCRIAATRRGAPLAGSSPYGLLMGQCRPPDYVPVTVPTPTHAQVEAPIAVSIVAVPRARVAQLASHRAIRVSFTARLAVTKAADAYEVVEATSSPLAVFAETQRDVAAGETVSWLLPASRPGTYSGTVTLGIGVPPAYPIYSYSPGPLVGRFSIRVP